MGCTYAITVLGFCFTTALERTRAFGRLKEENKGLVEENERLKKGDG